MKRFLRLLLVLAATSSPVLAADLADRDIRNVIDNFQQAIERHDVAAIGILVSPDIVVLENGHRNDGWTDFRDNHLIPEFKEPVAPSKWEFVKVIATSEMAWGYTKQTIAGTGEDGKPAAYQIWSVYIIQKSGNTWKVVLLDWSARRLGAPD